MLLSRYHARGSDGGFEQGPRSGLFALVVISNPNNLKDYDLAPIDVAAELALARDALGDVDITALTSDGVPGRTSLDALVDGLHRRPDILYLVCHGVQEEDGGYICLEDEHGKAHLVSSAELLARLENVSRPPALVVLISCHSGGDRDDPRPALALGPRLAAWGCPAALAINGKLRMDDTRTIFGSLFRSLWLDCNIERALAVARNTAAQREGWWRPVLYTTLQDGLLWPSGTPGRTFSGVPDALEDYVRRLDTHTYRVAVRLGLVPPETPELGRHAHIAVELALPVGERLGFHVNAVAHGRARCHVERPDCPGYPVAEHCVAPEQGRYIRR